MLLESTLFVTIWIARVLIVSEKLEECAQTLCNNVDVLSHVERIRRERVFLTKLPSLYDFSPRYSVVC